MNELILKGERLDDLCVHGWKIIQNPKEFCFSIDAVLLAHFVSIRQRGKIVDLGTGTGIIPILLAARGAEHITGLELRETMVDMANRSVQYNDLTKKVEIIQGDIRNIEGIFHRDSFSLTVCNPPYWPKGNGKVSPCPAVAAARHELTLSLSEVVQAAAYLTQFRGRVAMIYLAERLTEVVCLLSKSGLEPKRLQLIQPFRHKKPNLVLIEAVKGGKPGVDVCTPLVIYGEDGQYTQEVLKYYGG